MRILPAVAITLASVSLSLAQVSFQGSLGAVLTSHNDGYRTGTNPSETILTPALLNSGNFGKLATFSVDGYVYAQPLYLPNVPFGGQTRRNLVIIATENDSLYAFDATTNAQVWKTSFINPAKGIVTVPNNDVNSNDIVPQIGITGTPVIDPTTNTVYLVSKVKLQPPATTTGYAQQLHAIDAATGKEKFGGPTLIKAQAAGNCAPNDNQGHVYFSALKQHNRPGLALISGVVYIAFASHGDQDAYQGWLLGYKAGDITQQVSVLNTVPNYTPGNGSECRGGIWQGGAAPGIDASGNIFLSTGNGPFNVDSGGTNYGDSVLRIAPGGVTIADYFTPDNQSSLNGSDSDLGAGGVLLLPDQPGTFPHLLVSVGKEGSIFVVNRDNMGHYNPSSDSQIVQYLPFAVGGVWGLPAYWNNTVFFAGQKDNVKAYGLANGVLTNSPTSKSSKQFGYPGPGISVSSSGTAGAILWALQGDTFNVSAPTLYAYDATNLATVLYNSSTANGGGDVPSGTAVKFAMPTIANGKVYIGSSNAVTVYGKLH